MCTVAGRTTVLADRGINSAKKKSAKPMNNRQPQFELSPREKEVLRLIAAGKSSKQIARDLGISFKTVVNHQSHIMAKLKVHDTFSLVQAAIRQKLIGP
jgi:DNA-binding NarL/FixJ family response regulator